MSKKATSVKSRSLVDVPGIAPRSLPEFVLVSLLAVVVVAADTTVAQPVDQVAESEVNAEIVEYVAALDTRTLVGQTMILGSWTYKDTDASNEGLVELIHKYAPGGIILFKHNFKRSEVDSGSGTIRWLSDIEVANSVSSLTRRLQAEAANNSSQLPLFIALDQEGGGSSRLTKGVTRTPYAIQIGATRSAPLAFDAGRIIGDELTDLGINMVLAPVADVNNNSANDVIGRRAFGAHPEIVTPLACAFAKGLQDGGVLSVAKHFPGHGSSQDDPHHVLPELGYEDQAQLEDTDLVPFKELVQQGIDGLLTAHIMVDFLDRDEPITFSKDAVERLIRRDLGFNKLVIVDDLSAMQGARKDSLDPKGPNRWTHSEIVQKAYEAGNDMLILGYIQRDEFGSEQERDVTLTHLEFEDVFNAALEYFDDPQPSRRAHKRQQLESSVVRILKAKTRILGSWDRVMDRTGWSPVFSEEDYREKLKDHRLISEEIARSSTVLISEGGRFMNTLDESKYFGGGAGPLTKGEILNDADDFVTVVSPVFREDKLSEEIKQRWINPSRVNTVRLVYGYYSNDAIKGAERYWGEEVHRFSHKGSDGELIFNEDAIVAKAEEIIYSSRNSKVVVFGVLTRAHVRILNEVLNREREQTERKYIVLLLREPYFVPSELYEFRSVSFLFVPALPSMSIAVDVLFGDLQPHPVSHLPVSVPGKINRNQTLGAKVELLDGVNGPGAEDVVEPPGLWKRISTWLSMNVFVWVALVGGLIGAFLFWAIPHGTLRWNQGAKSQWNLVDFGLSSAFGISIGGIIGLVSPSVESIREPVAINDISPVLVGVVAFILTIGLEVFWLLKFRHREDSG